MAFIQSQQSIDTVLTLNSLPVIGNTLLVAVLLTDNATIGSYTISDNQAGGGNSYVPVVTASVTGGFGDGNGNLIILYANVTKSSGTFTITVTYTPGVGSTDYDYGVACAEYSGLTSSPNLNVTNTGSGSGTTASPGAINPSSQALYFSVVSVPFLQGAVTSLNSFNIRLSPAVFTGIEDIVGTGSKTGSFTITSQAWLSAVAAFAINQDYSSQNPTVLPTNNNELSYIFQENDFTTVALNDSNRITQTGTNGYNEFQFKDKFSPDEIISVTWIGQTSWPPASNSVILQIWNVNSSSWETLSSNSSASVNTDFTLNGTQSLNMINYFDTNGWVTCRVYQQVPSSSSSCSSSSSRSSSSSSCRSSSSSSSRSSSSSSSCRSSSSSSSSCRSSSSSCRSSSSSSHNCWVASEIFGGWYEPRTVLARFYINTLAPAWFRNFYSEYSRPIARFISNKLLFKIILRPLFEYFVRKAKEYENGV